ncbi:ricin-type beta-trefoil lectin domain protein [Trichocoleus desertorum AS-A10]|uniref:ricin-type beta-trefoil lectin domain protein n=1 Tax=Trichocoleus desertorum TaxID=1481672 RepID=UPI003298DAC9
MIVRFKLPLDLITVVGFLFVELSIGASTNKAQATETFSIDGKALNTNDLFRKIDGQPRISIWEHNASDQEQQFEQLSGSRGGILLKHHSTGKCLNAHYLTNGSEINIWPCDADDHDQNWTLDDVGSGRFLIMKTGTNLCVDTPTRDNGGNVHLWDCNKSNPNQKWLSSAYVSPIESNIIIQPRTTNLSYYRGQQWITSNNYKFIFQADGNLVLYNPQGTPIWATGTDKTTADLLNVQADGNVVLYDQGRPIWATDTSGHPGAFLAIQADGNIVVYASNNIPLFATGTDGGRVRTFTASADWLNKLKLSYRSDIESILRDFFSNFSNTNNENWSQKSLTDIWDRVGGESAQFINGNYSGDDKWKAKMPTDAYGVYQDLANTIFSSSVPAVNTGYAYDYGYYSDSAAYGAHSGLDIQGTSGTVIRSAVKGKVVKTVDDGGNGWWIAVDELDGDNQKAGRRWWYGHLQSPAISVGNVITAGQIISRTNGLNHLHLTVVDTYSDSVQYAEVSNGKRKGSYSADVQDVLNRTMSPLQAYWNSRNGIKQ